jgi:hypothetical protein
MLEAKIIKTGRGPEIAGTRITVYDVIEYYETGWHRDRIAAILSLSSREVEAAPRLPCSSRQVHWAVASFGSLRRYGSTHFSPASARSIASSKRPGIWN